MSLLDTELLKERSLELGLSPIDLARQLGVSTVAIRSLEQGTNHEKLTLHKLGLLAAILGVPMGGLLSGEHQEAAPASPLELKAEAALALMGKRVYPQDFAKATRCTASQAHAAFACMRERHAGTGITVTYTGGQWGITASRTLLTDAEVQALERAAMTRSRINISDAVLLKKIIDRPNGLRQDELTEAQRPILARFLRLGWAEKQDSRYFPTDALRTCLRLEPQKGPVQRRPNGLQPRLGPVPKKAGAPARSRSTTR